ncbi:uncharacterized protein F4807DRAFT_424038 [Annulohypoxylon truncatum]|uniref:uncharacterized protein n=1 Tax=Annulohypoxylon truncatum TaxID=327061 RepID=UPI002007C4DF|nr:uncharacterized protein F4807DRAFT_424038 [Annulohypoxylon truncatum]KAI1210158.1 hypothetical protein F4807DRAFT_424038 [Annulohypoxylon truncatum]
MRDERDVPIALRRTPRLSVGKAAPSDLSRLETATASLRTPTKPRSKKRVRFSDPGPEIEHHNAASTTGLTPMVRRTTLGVAPSPKRRRHSAPTSRRSNSEGEEDELSYNSNGNSGNEIRFLSLRQVLDDRVKRRIRRNGLSEEMNTITQEKRRRTQGQKAELERLQHELAEKDHEIERLQNSTTVAQDTGRIMELEYEIDSLRNELRSRSSGSGSGPDPDQTQAYDWTMAARDPFSDSYMDDDDGFGDTTMADLVCSTPSKNRASASFPTPPCTSPTIPTTPCSMRRGAPVTPQSHAGVGMQADMGVQTSFTFPDPEEKEALEAELGSLRLELTKLTEVLETHEAFKSRITDKLSAVRTPTESEEKPTTMDVEAHLDTVLQSLSDRTAALLDLNTSLSGLGFPGSDASEIITSLTSAFRSARLELEYLTPGELTLPLSSRGAQVLDLVLVRLRDLARQVKEDEDAIDEYHALELSLRQQLGARVDAMDHMRRQREEDRAALSERDARIADLEVGVERLKGAAEGYRRDVAELEGLVQRMEDESRTESTRLSAELAGAQAEVECTRAGAAKLEAKLSAVREQAEAFKAQLADLQKRKACEMRALNKYHGTALAVRDARVLELRRSIEDVSRSLHEAHSMVQRLRVENLGLSRRVDEERNRATAAVDSMKVELERVLRMSAEFLATPTKDSGRSGLKRRSVAVGGGSADSGSSGEGEEGEGETTTPEGSPLSSGSYLAGALAKSGKGKKKRKYDSGLGLLDEDEDGSVDLV